MHVTTIHPTQTNCEIISDDKKS